MTGSAGVEDCVEALLGLCFPGVEGPDDGEVGLGLGIESGGAI